MKRNTTVCPYCGKVVRFTSRFAVISQTNSAGMELYNTRRVHPKCFARMLEDRYNGRKSSK